MKRIVLQSKGALRAEDTESSPESPQVAKLAAKSEQRLDLVNLALLKPAPIGVSPVIKRLVQGGGKLSDA